MEHSLKTKWSLKLIELQTKYEQATDQDKNDPDFYVLPAMIKMYEMYLNHDQDILSPGGLPYKACSRVLKINGFVDEFDIDKLGEENYLVLGGLYAVRPVFIINKEVFERNGGLNSVLENPVNYNLPHNAIYGAIKQLKSGHYLVPEATDFNMDYLHLSRNWEYAD